MKLIFFDIDGTLITYGKNPSPATVEAIRACRARGHKVFLCTGRTEASTPQMVKDIGFDGGIYSAGGRIIADGRDLRKSALSPEQVSRIEKVMEEEQINYTLECENHLFEGAVELQVDEDMIRKGSSELQRFIELWLRQDSICPLSSYQGEEVYKVTFRALTQQQFDNLTERLGQEMKIVTFDSMFTNVPVIAGEMSDYSVNKGEALEYLCKYFHEDLKDTIAFGDSMNDAEILETAGLGIAMGNSVEEVKKLADCVCGCCEEDGVALALKELGLI